MGIKPANSHYESFTFNGTAASTYGVYVTDVNVFDAPERSVEYISIPGRNGAFALDKGSFENITIEYSCAMQQDSDADFADAISQFRNLLASAKGYCRLSDDMNASEYRMACFSGGLEVETENQRSGTFTVAFNCKPQRYLTSGETAVAVANNGTLTNPTLFDAKPLLEITGYGEFSVNGEELEIVSEAIGATVVRNSGDISGGGSSAITKTLTFSTQYANAGDDIYSQSVYMNVFCSMQGVNKPLPIDSATVVHTSGTSSVTETRYQNVSAQNGIVQGTVYYNLGTISNFDYGTAASYADTNTWTVTGNGMSKTLILDTVYSYDGDDTITLSLSISGTLLSYASLSRGMHWENIILDSTQSALGSPLYFDLDIGEAYKIENGEVVSVNNAVSIPAKLPTLPKGTNTFTYDNTITQFKVVPRWWKV